jgi:hypothetical protein
MISIFLGSFIYSVALILKRDDKEKKMGNNF